MHDDEVAIDAGLARRLITTQLPQFADLELRLVEPWGTDHAIWRLGDDLVARFPRIGWAQRQVEFEAAWLSRLAGALPVEVPRPIAVGEPALGYPFRWAIHRWIAGAATEPGGVGDPVVFAADLAWFVGALRSVSIEGAPPARHRARPIEAYDEATRAAIAAAGHLVDADAALAIWEEARAADPHEGPPVWVHGDLEGNCLVRDGRLAAVIDWGSACAGDPAVDVQALWSELFTDGSRQAFVDLLDVDDATLARSRGAAVHQACAALPYYLDTSPLIVRRSLGKLAALGIAVTLPSA